MPSEGVDVAESMPPPRGEDFGNVLDESAIAYVRVDGKGIVLQRNPPAAGMLGSGRAKAPLVFASRLLPRSIAPFHRFLIDLIRSRRPATILVELRSPERGPLCVRVDGTWLRGEELNAPGSCLLSLVDVSEQQRTQERLRSSEARLRQLFDALPDAVFVASLRGIRYLNTAAIRLLGLQNASQLLGRRLETFVAPSHLDALQSLMAEFLLTGGARPRCTEVEFVTESGHALVAETSWVEEVFEGERCVVCVARNVLERRDLLLQVAQADRLSMVSTLAAGVAHEVNNPLTYVLMNLDKCLDGLPPDGSANGRISVDQLRAALREALEGVQRVRTIVRDLNRFSRFDAQTSLVDVNDSVRKALQLASAELRYRATVVQSLTDLPPVRATEGHLVQVLLNLLLNAAEAIEHGSPDRNRVSVSTTVSGGNVVIAVEDTGCGIPAEMRERLFDPFFTTKHGGRGTGLGLFVCYNYVRELGGEIRVESDGATWSRFSVALPSALPAQEPSVRALATPPMDPISGRILVIDDEEIIRIGVVAALRKTNTVDAVDSAEEALARIDRGEHYDLVLCDLQMPGLPGSRFYAALAARYPHLVERVIFMTGGAFTHEAKQFLEDVDPPVLAKPFTLKELRQTLWDRIAQLRAQQPKSAVG